MSLPQHIGGGYLYIKDSRASNNTGISVEINPNGTSFTGHDSNYVFNIQKEIYEMCGVEFNISSPKQLGEVLFDKLGLPHGKKTATGSYKTGEDVLEKIINEHPVISKISMCVL